MRNSDDTGLWADDESDQQEQNGLRGRAETPWGNFWLWVSGRDGITLLAVLLLGIALIVAICVLHR